MVTQNDNTDCKGFQLLHHAIVFENKALAVRGIAFRRSSVKEQDLNKLHPLYCHVFTSCEVSYKSNEV